MSSKNRLDPIPQPPTKPVVGNMLSLDSAAPVQHLTRLAKELGPIFWLDMMGSPIVVVSGHDLVDELSDEKRFDKTVRGALRRVRAVGGDGLFTADTSEPNWSKAHNILLQPFGNRAMQSYHPSMVDIAEQLVKKWERLNADDEIDVVHDMTALTLDTIGLCGFDYRFNSFYRRDYHPFVESLVRSLETIMMTRGLPLEQLWMQKRRKTLAEDVAFMNKMVDEIIAERRKSAEATDDKKDMLGAMMTGVDRSTGEQLDDINIRYQINTFLIAGHETTSGLLSCTLYALLKHPDILKKAYDEVDRVLGPDVNAQADLSAGDAAHLHHADPQGSAAAVAAGAGLWHLAAEGRDHRRRQVQAEEGHLHHHPGDGAASRSLGLGSEPGRVRSREFQPRGGGQTADQRLEAVRQRPARLHRPRLCHARGGARARHDPPALQADRHPSLPDASEGNADDEAGRLQDQGASARRSRARRLAAGPWRLPLGRGGAASAAARPGHNTPMLVLYGSNLGTAEELATRMADLAEINGFASSSAPLDDYVGKLPQEGGVLIFCASYNGAPPDNATQFVKWLGDDLPKDAFANVRYAVFGCGNSDWAATYQSVPRFIDEQLSAHGARASIRAAKAMRAAISTASSRNGSPRPPRSRPRNSASTGISPAPPRTIRSMRSSRWRSTAVNTIVAQGGAVADEGAGQ